MLWFSLFFCELIILFLLSRQLTRLLSSFLFAVTRSQRVTISIVALLFFPGTVIHELAHALTASLLGVRVGKMEFIPKVDGDRVKLGSVQIAQSDPIRRFLIGAAPFFVGTLLLLGLLYFSAQHYLFENTPLLILIGYGVFEIGNTLFSSKKDMEGAFELLAVLLVFLLAFYLLGVRIPEIAPLALIQQPLVQEILQRGSWFLLIPLSLDALIILMLRLFHSR